MNDPILIDIAALLISWERDITLVAELEIAMAAPPSKIITTQL